MADHPRNVPDDILKQLPKNGGVVMVNFYSGFVVPKSAEIGKSLSSKFRELREKYRDNKEQYKIEAGRLEKAESNGTRHCS